MNIEQNLKKGCFTVLLYTVYRLYAMKVQYKVYGAPLPYD